MHRALFGALGLSSGTEPLPLPTNTPPAREAQPAPAPRQAAPGFDPFGGFKNSGIGREKGIDGLKLYAQVKSLYFGLHDKPLSVAK